MKCGVSKVRYLANGTPNCALASVARSKSTHAKIAARAGANRTSMLVSDEVARVVAVVNAAHSRSRVEAPVEDREGDGTGQTRKRSVLGNLLGRVEEASPRRARQRAADTDPTDAKRGQLPDRREIAAHEHVHRLWRNRTHHRGDVALLADTGRVEAIGTRFRVRREPADG